MSYNGTVVVHQDHVAIQASDEEKRAILALASAGSGGRQSLVRAVQEAVRATTEPGYIFLPAKAVKAMIGQMAGGLAKPLRPVGERLAKAERVLP